MKSEEKDPHLVQSVLRTLRILELLNDRGETALGEIASSLCLDKSTVYRLLATLKHLGYVRQTGQYGAYANTLKLFEMGTIEADRLGFKRMAQPYLQSLARQTRETINLAILSGAYVMYIDKIESPEAIRVGYGIGKRVPAYATGLGKILLAHLPEGDVRRILAGVQFVRFTPNTVSDLEELLPQLRVIRKRGFATDNEEYAKDLSCVAAPVLNPNGDVLAALSVAYLRYRYRKGGSDEKRFQHLVVSAAASLSADLGVMRTCTGLPETYRSAMIPHASASKEEAIT